MTPVDPTPAAPDQAEGPRERCVECGATDTLLERGADGQMRCLRRRNRRGTNGISMPQECHSGHDTAAPSSSSSGAPEPPLERQRRDLSPIPLYTLTPPIVSTDMLFGPGAAYIQPRAPAPDAGTTDADEPIDGELLDTAECSAYPNRGRCTHTRCLLRERNSLAAELSRLRASLAERQGAEPPTGSKTREIL